MKHTTLAATLATATLSLCLATSAHANECHFDKTLTVSGTPALFVNTGSGDVRVMPGKDGEIHISGRVRSSHSGWFGGSSNEGQVQPVCDHPPIEQNGTDVRIGKDRDNSEMYRHVSIDYVIETPAATQVNANSGSGNLELHELTSRVTANTGSGDIRASNLGADSKLETGSGNIQADGLAGDAKLETGSGDIRLQQSSPGNIRAHTGSGNIEIASLTGGLNAGTGSGEIHVTGSPTETWKLETGSGNVHLNIPSSKGFELDAEASSGNINVAQPITMQGSLNKHHVHGNVSGGGPLIHIETGSGDIDIN
jgi:hypothetical protein